MKEPHRSEFKRLLQSGAGGQDIHDARSTGASATAGRTNDAYIQREIDRVKVHQRSLCPLLEEHVGKVDDILDVGCSTGGTTVALALSTVLGARWVTGIDPNELSLRAAPVRARAHIVEDRVRFQHVNPGPLPFENRTFDLVVTVSVLEFIMGPASRVQFIEELKRVTRPGGFIFMATPSPLRLRELHSRRLFGDFRRRDGFPWATPSWQLKRMLGGYESVPLGRALVAKASRKLGLKRVPFVPAPLLELVPHLMSWQKHLFRKPNG